MSRTPSIRGVPAYGRTMRDDPRLPTSPGFWRSPLRGPWFTSVLGIVLLVGIMVLFVTGLVSYAAYSPGLSPLNDKTPDKGILGFYPFAWPTNPHWRRPALSPTPWSGSPCCCWSGADCSSS